MHRLGIVDPPDTWMKGALMSRNDRHVDVKAPGADRTSAHADTQANAEARAKEIVSDLGGGGVIIHRADGRIRDKDTVAPGNDPYPPKDTKH